MKKRLLSVGLAFILAISLAIPVFAETVYYKGDAVYWDYGVTPWRVCYSKVMSSQYRHSATANKICSGMQAPGTLAEAKQFVGTGRAYAYWNCEDD